MKRAMVLAVLAAVGAAGAETVAPGAGVATDLEVASGTTTLVAHTGEVVFDPGEDSMLTNIARLVFWVDANRNAAADASGAVLEWDDVRETFPDGARSGFYKRARVHVPAEGSGDVPGQGPTFKTDDRYPGMKFLDFGDYGSGRWMYLADANGNMLHQRTFTWYCVVGFDTPDNCGHILSDVSALSAKGAGSVYFHKGTGGSAAGYISATSADSCMYNGETRLNGARIDPTTRTFDYADFQVLGQIGPGAQVKSDGKTYDPKFSTLFNDRNIAFPGSPSGYRQGGGVLGELLVWNVVLTEAQRRKVEAYLMAKWKGRTYAGRAAIASGASLVSGLGARDGALVAVTGDGTLVKQGAGALALLDGADARAAALQVREGAVSVQAGLVSGLNLAPAAGVKTTLGAPDKAGVAVSASEAPAGVAGIDGGTATSAVTVAPAALPAKLRVARAALTLRPTASASFADAPSPAERYPNLLRNGSFENQVVADKSYNTVGAASGWMGNGNSVIGTYLSPWYGAAANGAAVPNTIPDGRQYAALQGSGAAAGFIEQAFEAPFAGLYRLTYYLTRRTNRGEKDGETILQVLVDGEVVHRNVVAADARGDKNVFKRYGALLPALARGAHTIRFQILDNVTTDRAVVLDDIRLFPVAQGDYLAIPNAGFDGCAKVVVPQDPNGWFIGSTEAAQVVDGWTATIPDRSIMSCGLTQHSSWWSWLNSRESATDPVVDYRKAYLQRAVTLETTFTAPRDGAVRVAFDYSNRSNYSWMDNSGGPRVTGHGIALYVDDVLAARAFPQTQLMRTCQGGVELTKGPHVLKFVNEIPEGRTDDFGVIVDEVRVVYADSEPGAGWPIAGLDSSWDLNDGELANRSRDLESGALVYWMKPGGAFSRTDAAVPSNGFYQVRIDLHGAPVERGSAAGVYHGYKHYPVACVVQWDGVDVGRILLQDEEARTMAVPLPWSEEGAHALRFYCPRDCSADGAKVFVTGAQVVPMSVGPLPGAAATCEAELELGAGATLDLQYDGVLTVRSLKVEGKAYTGRLGAAELPSALSGPGRLLVRGRGCCIFVR